MGTYFLTPVAADSPAPELCVSAELPESRSRLWKAPLGALQGKSARQRAPSLSLGICVLEKFQ